MSRLEGLEELVSPEDRERYEPGTPGFDSDLMDFIVERYFEDGGHSAISSRRNGVRYLTKLLRGQELNPNAVPAGH